MPPLLCENETYYKTTEIMKLLRSTTLVKKIFSQTASFIQDQNDLIAISQKLKKPFTRLSALPIQHTIGMNLPAFAGSNYTAMFQPIVQAKIENLVLFLGQFWVLIA